MTDILSGVLPTSDPDTDPGTPDQSEIDEHLVCVERIAVTHDVTTFVLAPRSTRWFYFQPGQYVTITVNLDGQEVNRCYTISSPPTRPDRLTITVKRVPGGPVSNWLHDRLTVGDTVPVTGPLGRFTTDRHPASKYLFLSAGSGITPLMSMTRTIIDLDTEVDVIFVHNARTPDDIIFRRELETIAADHPKVTVVAICEQDSTSQEWAGHRGRLSLPLLRDIAVDLPEREIFTCGPAPYMTAVRSMLDEAGADPARRHEETFSFEDLIGTRALASSESSVPTSEQVAAEVKTFS
ncbi:MAG: FAD-binding oxidoreductase, partial [Microlunatus sp.]|nr:FAD-binding oxidoreductase [Microlunatus sp.]